MKIFDQARLMVLIAATLSSMPVAGADDIGHGRDDPGSAPPPGDSDAAVAENILQELLVRFLPQEDEAERDER
ncbi:MAG TPA: hypothetical protein VF254_05505 [Gammaproteobacteria bacterium]